MAKKKVGYAKDLVPNKGGRPFRFKTPEELAELLGTYFEETPIQEWTVTGMCLATRTSKQLLANYEKHEDERFREVVKRAKMMVENSYELSLRRDGGAHNIFALKNFGWTDKQEHAVGGLDGGPLETKHTYDFSDLEPEERDAVRAILNKRAGKS